MSITNTQINAITEPGELCWRLGVASGEVDAISGYPWDVSVDPADLLPWLWKYNWRFMRPYHPLPGERRFCYAYTDDDDDADRACGACGVTRTSGEGNTALIKRALVNKNNSAG